MGAEAPADRPARPSRVGAGPQGVKRHGVRVGHPGRFPDRCFAFDQFGPLSIHPCHGSGWAKESRPDRPAATYRRTHGIRYFHGCYSLGDDQLWSITRRRKSGEHSLAALESIRAARPDGAPIYVIMDNPLGEQDPRHPQVGA